MILIIILQTKQGEVTVSSSRGKACLENDEKYTGSFEKNVESHKQNVIYLRNLKSTFRAGGPVV